MLSSPILFSFFFFNDTATTEIYTLSLHDALPISSTLRLFQRSGPSQLMGRRDTTWTAAPASWSNAARSEEHTSELQSLAYLVCRLLLEKKKKRSINEVSRLRMKHTTNLSHRV